MKSKYLFLAGVILVTSSGCLWPFGHSRSSSLSSAPVPTALVDIQQPELLAKGGKLVFIPFTAGLNAAADQQLDRLSLMIVKGASDAFRAGSSSIQMIDEGDPDVADLILEGHVEEFRSASRGNVVGLGKRVGLFVVKGKLRDRRTHEILAIISVRKEFRDAKKAESLAYDVGREIAGQLIERVSRP